MYCLDCINNLEVVVSMVVNTINYIELVTINKGFVNKAIISKAFIIINNHYNLEVASSIVLLGVHTLLVHLAINID